MKQIRWARTLVKLNTWGFMLPYYVRQALQPYDLDESLNIDDAWLDILRKQDRNLLNKYLYSIDGMRMALEEQYMPKPYELGNLKDCKPDTLGYVYYNHMVKHKFTPNFFRPIDVVDDLSYLLLRTFQVHDIWHVVTGFKADIVGECSLEAFYNAQGFDIFDDMTLFLLNICIIGTRPPGRIVPLLQGVWRGYTAGKVAKPFLPVKWEENWDRPINDLRRELNVVSVIT